MKRIALVLPVLLVAACGGSDGPSKSDYLAKAEAICKKANDDIDALAPPSDVKGIETFLNSLVATADQTTDELERLDTPKDDTDALQSKFLKPLRTQVDEGREWADKVKTAAASNDQAKVFAALGDAPKMTEADEKWMTGYGFKECVEAADTEE